MDCQVDRLTTLAGSGAVPPHGIHPAARRCDMPTGVYVRKPGSRPVGPRTTLNEKFFSGFTAGNINECWEWQKGLHGTGIHSYGNIGHDRKKRYAHRTSWEIYKGKIPHGMNVCHHCDNPKCVNPSHLFLGTSKDNAIDCSKKGRFKKQSITHCPQGHPYSGTNLILRRNGLARRCRICTNAANKKYRDSIK